MTTVRILARTDRQFEAEAVIEITQNTVDRLPWPPPVKTTAENWWWSAEATGPQTARFSFRWPFREQPPTTARITVTEGGAWPSKRLSLSTKCWLEEQAVPELTFEEFVRSGWIDTPVTYASLERAEWQEAWQELSADVSVDSTEGLAS